MCRRCVQLMAELKVERNERDTNLVKLCPATIPQDLAILINLRLDIEADELVIST
jgi:hypothetical protein